MWQEDEEARDYARELAAEVAGVPYAEGRAKGVKAGVKTGVTAVGKAGAKGSEEKELAMLMMSRKKRRLYDRMQFGIERKVRQ